MTSASEGLMNRALALLVVAILGVTAMPAEAAEKTIIGDVEDVVLLPWGVKLPARIDTGATMSSMDVCDYTVEGKYVAFTLADRCGGAKNRLPLLGWKNVHTSEGSDRRPVVMIDICLGTKRLKTHFTLNDRSRMEYPLLVGRTALRGKFIVDVSRTKTLPPRCPGIKPATPSDIKAP